MLETPSKSRRLGYARVGTYGQTFVAHGFALVDFGRIENATL
jgi:hypothetical protein